MKNKEENETIEWKYGIKKALFLLIVNLLKRNTIILVIFMGYAIYTFHLTIEGFNIALLEKWALILQTVAVSLGAVFTVFLGANQVQRFIEKKFIKEKKKLDL